jgi:hypothetical protein
MKKFIKLLCINYLTWCTVVIIGILLPIDRIKLIEGIDTWLVMGLTIPLWTSILIYKSI